MQALMLELAAEKLAVSKQVSADPKSLVMLVYLQRDCCMICGVLPSPYKPVIVTGRVVVLLAFSSTAAETGDLEIKGGGWR